MRECVIRREQTRSRVHDVGYDLDSFRRGRTVLTRAPSHVIFRSPVRPPSVSEKVHGTRDNSVIRHRVKVSISVISGNSVGEAEFDHSSLRA